MQLVIEISDKIYNKVKEHNIGFEEVYDIGERIRNGKLLPEGHGRLIDADEIQFENTEFDTYGDYCIAFDAIDQADTIIEADEGDAE